MTDWKREKRDTRSSVTVHLPAVHADFLIKLLSKELEWADREGQADQSAVLRAILELFRRAVELEERQRTLRKTDLL